MNSHIEAQVKALWRQAHFVASNVSIASIIPRGTSYFVIAQSSDPDLEDHFIVFDQGTYWDRRHYHV